MIDPHVEQTIIQVHVVGCSLTVFLVFAVRTAIALRGGCGGGGGGGGGGCGGGGGGGGVGLEGV